MRIVHGNFHYDPSYGRIWVKKNPEASVAIDMVERHLTHDVVRYPKGLKRVCLNIFEGNEQGTFKHKFVEEIDDDAARDLEALTYGFLPSAEIMEVRTLLRQLALDPALNRVPYLCDICGQY